MITFSRHPWLMYSLGIFLVSTGVVCLGNSDQQQPVPPVEAPSTKPPQKPVLLPPAGSTLQKLRLPRYEGTKLTLYVTAHAVTIVSDKEIKGDSVHAQSYQKEGGVLEVRMKDALYNTESGWLRSSGDTELDEARYHVKGKDSVLDLNLKKGFIKGPVKTTIIFKPQ